MLLGGLPNWEAVAGAGAVERPGVELGIGQWLHQSVGIEAKSLGKVHHVSVLQCQAALGQISDNVAGCESALM